MKSLKEGNWQTSIDVRDFIMKNYTQYEGDESFLQSVTDRTKDIWSKVGDLIQEETKKGILDLDVENPSSITSHSAGYIDKENELIVGLQTDKPLKRAIKPNGGIKLVESAAESYGYKIPEQVSKIYTDYRQTHNQAVFDVYTDEHRLLRSKHIITGLPDAYGRGRIIGDYRRVALYGVDRLIEEKQKDMDQYSKKMDEWTINYREEVSQQIKALSDLKTMAGYYGFDISKPATDTKEAIQWMYFAYLGAVKRQDGAAMSFGKIDAFLDIYAQRDLEEGKYNESQIQEFIDDFVIKLRIVRHLRPPLYNELFAGDPTWITLVIGGETELGEHMVTKTAYRLLHTLTNLGPAPEPNITILWNNGLPTSWKKYCSKMSIESSSIQYESDALMSQYHGDDYGIACCVSAMRIGKEMQLFGARCNLAKALLLTINGGKTEPQTHLDKESEDYTGGLTIIPDMKALNETEHLEFEEVWEQFLIVMDWLADRYVNIMNVIHYMHDKYHYESLQMALHDSQVHRFMAFGIAALSSVVDSLSAIKYAKVKPVWNEKGVAEDYIIEGDYPKFGNDDDRVDAIAQAVVKAFIGSLKRYPTYRDSEHTLSVLTITFNVFYGNGTGATPDGRKSGEAFAPGANPMHGRDTKGAVASLNSVAKIPYSMCRDGISNTFSIVPTSLGKSDDEQISNLVQMLDGYFVEHTAHHLNVNVLNKDMLLDAQKNPEKYPQLTIRVSGYAVLFNKLNKIQQDEVIARTFHQSL